MQIEKHYSEQIKEFAKIRVELDQFNNKVLDQTSIRKAIAKQLTECAYFTGVRELSTSMIEMLVEFTISHYCHFTAPKIKLAFEMAIAGKLECDAEHFGAFSGVFLSKIFNAYLIMENKLISEIIRKQEIAFWNEKQSETINPLQIAKQWAPTIFIHGEQLSNSGQSAKDYWKTDTMQWLQAKVLYNYLTKVEILKIIDQDFRITLGMFCAEMYMDKESIKGISSELSKLYLAKKIIK